MTVAHVTLRSMSLLPGQEELALPILVLQRQ